MQISKENTKITFKVHGLNAVVIVMLIFPATFNLVSNSCKNCKIIGVCSNVIMHAVMDLYHVSVEGLSRDYTVPVCVHFV